jgi:DNA-binding beta-propeller fold protein YncE
MIQLLYSASFGGRHEMELRQGTVRGAAPEGGLTVSLRAIGTVVLPPHRAAGGFDHASVFADRLYVAHTINDAVEVVDLEGRVHERTLEGFPGVAGVAIRDEDRLLVATCKRAGHVGVAALDEPTRIRRIPVGDRPNGLALGTRRGVALAACVGDPGTPSMAIVDLDRGEVVASMAVPGRTRWTVYDPAAGCFYVNISAPPQILVVSAAPPFRVLRSIPIPVAGPHGLDQDARRGLLHCACDAGAVVTVEAASGRVVAQVPIAGAPDVVFLNPRRDRLYVAVGDPGVLQSVDTAGARVVETIPTGKGAHTFGFDAGREHVYVLVPGTHAAKVFAEG